MVSVVRVNVVAVGDSILAARDSWGRMLTDAAGWPLNVLAAGGVDSTVALSQLDRAGGFGVVLLSIGTNDVLCGWSPGRFARNVNELVRLDGRVLVQTIPLGLSRVPGASRKLASQVAVANEILRATGKEIVDGSDLAGPLLKPDRIHPTHAGQSLLAARAGELLDVTIPVLPPVPTATPLRERVVVSREAVRRRAGAARRRLTA